MSGVMNMLLGARTTITAAVDEFFNRVTLLLPGDGTNGTHNNTFLDSGTANGGVGFPITRNPSTGPNAPTQGTFSPFSQTGWSMYAGSSGATVVGAYLNGESDFAFGTGDFTIEMFINLSPSGANQVFYDSRPAASNGAYQTIYLDNSATKLKYYVDSADRITQTSTFTYNVWHHVVITRTGTSTKMFVDGVQEGSTYTDSTNYLIGTNRPSTANGNNNSESPVGYISNLRVVKGSGPYQSAGSSITVPTSPLTPVTNTVLLTLQSNRFVDTNTQVAAKTINTVNNPSIQAFSPFAPTAAYSAATVGGSGYFDGTGDYLSVPDDVAFTMGAGDFCLEAWVYVTSNSGSQTIFGTSDSSGTPGSVSFILQARNTSGFPIVYVGYAGALYSATSSEALVPNQWTHIAGVRNGATVSIYVNGKSRGTLNMAALSIADSTQIVGIGRNGNFNGEYLTGYISGARIVKGSPVYTADFTPPTAPPTAITNTSLLLNFTNAGIRDATSDNVLETVGGVQISTTQSKWGGSSLYFDGTGDYLATPAVQNNELGTGDFTIEGWIYPANTSSAYRAIVASENYDGTAGGWSIYQNGTSLEVWLTSGQIINATSAITSSTWQHIALVRSGTGSNNVRMYVNGTQVGSSATNTASWTGRRVFIGDNNVAGTDYFFNGYIDDLRITRFARYSGTTIPVPTAAFPLS